MTADTARKGEAQYRDAIALMRHIGPQQLGLMSGWGFHDDPKRLAFTLSRYKFVAKMLAGCRHVAEIGCGDGFATRIVAQSVDKLTAFEFDRAFVDSAREIMSRRWTFRVCEHDILEAPLPVPGDGPFDAAYSLDVMEHIPPEQERLYLDNILAGLHRDGVLIVGMPSLQSQIHASAHSKAGHVNCKDQHDLGATLRTVFRNVFTFGMNDEVVHTGYHQMSHYNLALCCGKRSPE